MISNPSASPLLETVPDICHYNASILDIYLFDQATRVIQHWISRIWRCINQFLKARLFKFQPPQNQKTSNATIDYVICQSPEAIEMVCHEFVLTRSFNFETLSHFRTISFRTSTTRKPYGADYLGIDMLDNPVFKEEGLDKITLINLKICCVSIRPFLSVLFNHCLLNAHFNSSWNCA